MFLVELQASAPLPLSISVCCIYAVAWSEDESDD
jgi:hypothetical protein